MKKAFTLIEIIITIAILGILSAGTFVSLKHLYLRSAKSKAISELSFSSQIVVDQIAALLYERVPATVIGVKANGDFQPISTIDSNDFKILEWIGTSVEAYKQGYYSGFIDLDASNRDTNTTLSFDMNSSGISSVMSKKFGSFVSGDVALIFAGSFDDSSLVASSDFNSSFGWHGNAHELVSTFTLNGNDIIFDTRPPEIYEKYYLVDSAYAIARKEDITTTPCAGVNSSDDNNTLYLFYDYRPWNNQEFCNGKSTILSENVQGFQAGMMNNSLYFNVTLTKEIRGSDTNITISKEKVVF